MTDRQIECSIETVTLFHQPTKPSTSWETPFQTDSSIEGRQQAAAALFPHFVTLLSEHTSTPLPRWLPCADFSCFHFHKKTPNRRWVVATGAGMRTRLCLLLSNCGRLSAAVATTATSTQQHAFSSAVILYVCFLPQCLSYNN